MAGEQILVVDDTPVNLKLTRILLVNEGYKVITAASAEEALNLLRNYHPRLILTDVQLPGMDGLELARRVKQDPNTRDIAVVALTAFAMKGDEGKAIDAGCDGYITKPIDTRTLGARIREYLDRQSESYPAAAASPREPEGSSVPAVDMQSLRRRFLAEGRERARQFLLDLDGQFSANDVSKAVHQWVGTAGLLGYSAISRLAREAEAVLQERPVDSGQIRQALIDLALAFSSPRGARDAPLSEAIIQSLSGKRVAAVGLPPNEEERLCAALERVQALPVFFDISERPDSAAVQECDVAVVHIGPEAAGSPWLNPEMTIEGTRPMVFVGGRDHLLALEPQVQSLASEFLMDSWQPEEALVRLSLVFSQQHRTTISRPAPTSSPGPAPRPAAAPGHVQVVIADDDPTVLILVRTALQNFGMECHTSADGVGAIEAIRRHRPHAAVLDVNMPGMDGYQVLAAIRTEEIPVRVLLLTARQQESDVLRGFTLGADDYMVKPFSPMELVARLKRLLSR